MKNWFLLAWYLLPLSGMHAQSVFTLDGPSGSRVYSYIDSALKYAQDGDYLYLPGGNIYIPGTSMIIKKRLTILGAGHYLDSTVATGQTVVNGNIFLMTEATGSVLQGIYLTGSIQLGNSPPSSAAKNIFISRCNFLNLSLSYDNGTNFGAESILVKDNVVRGTIYLANVKNVVVETNIIEEGLIYATGQVLVKNNVFLRRSGPAVQYFSSARLENNIFLTSAGFFGGPVSNIDFFNNVFKEGDPLGSFNSVNNQFNVTNLFVNQSGNTFSYTQDYHLTANSPARNAGFDGKDCGLYGTANPYKEGAVPMNPHIQAKTIPMQTDGQGKINIEVKVAAQSN